MDQDLRVGKRVPLALRAAREEDRTHRGSHPGADRRDVTLHELHRVVDGQTRRDAASRAIDVHIDIFVGIFALEKQQLRDHQIREAVVDGTADENDALLQEPRVNVERTLAARALLDDHGN